MNESTEPDSVGLLVEQAYEMIASVGSIHVESSLGNWLRGYPKYSSIDVLTVNTQDPDVNLLYWLEHHYVGDSKGSSQVLTISPECRADFLARLRTLLALCPPPYRKS